MDEISIRRGPGRPPGSPNRPKLSPSEREELKHRLSAEYAEAIVAQALAQQRLKGIKALARRRLGAAGLQEIEAGLDAPADDKASSICQ